MLAFFLLSVFSVAIIVLYWVQKFYSVISVVTKNLENEVFPLLTRLQFIEVETLVIFQLMEK